MAKSFARFVRLAASGTFALSLVTPPLSSVLQAQATTASTQQVSQGSKSARPRITGSINQGNLVTLSGHVLPVLTPDRDLGLVEDSAPQRLYLTLKRSDAQQNDLDSFISEQQNPASPNFHKWLTPEQFGERFGVAESDIAQITQWLSLQGFAVTSVAKNASVINFMATAGGVRNTFHAQLHYWNVAGGKHIATANEPQIPAALSPMVTGIAGLNQLPYHTNHTPVHQERYNAETHQWFTVSPETANSSGAQTHYLNPSDGHYNMTPQDYYTIYNVNPTFAAGNHGEGSTIAILGSGPFNYGTVNGSGMASGGDVTTFRTLFGITAPLKLQIQNGDANFPCSGVGGTDSGESALDVEWSSALAPAATIIFNNCTDGNSFLTEIQALVDANVADVISSSLGISEQLTDAGSRPTFDMAFAQAAAQGQTILSAQGDSGSDDYDFGSSQGTHGLSIDYPSANPLVLSIGGTDFQDTYDSMNGGVPQSTYWSATNSQFYGDALSYVPEMTWNESCASPFIAQLAPIGGTPGETPATFCDTNGNGMHLGGGGGGGVSIFYKQPSWQTGFPGLSASVTTRATPDVSMFSSGGSFWGHGTVLCDSGDPNAVCSPGTFGGAGGTSFAAPEFAGILGLIRTGTGSRQGLVQPALYALARAQYNAGTACYANGQTANTGLTTGLPASSCIFHDVTTSTNDNECVAGSTNCFSNPGASYGVLTASADTSIYIPAYPAGAQYDLATGLGSVNVTNLVNKWSSAFSSSTSLQANPTTITTAQSTSLTANVTGGTPTGYTGTAPVLAGSVTFNLNGSSLGSCTLSGGTCSINVAGSALTVGSNSITATFTSTGAYPASTSSAATVTVTSTQSAQTITFGALPNVTYGVSPITLHATASSGLPVSYTVTGPATVSGSTLTITGAGMVTVTASQAGNSSYSAATPVQQSFTVAKATLTVTAASPSRMYGAANPTLTYAVTGYVNNDSSSVVSGSATLTTTATSTSPVGSYPITFATQALTATNYTFTYVSGTLNVTIASQTITFGPLANVTYPNPPNTVALTATASSGLPVSYTVTGPATVSGSTLTVTGAGQITVTASQAGNSSYSAASPVQQSFTATASVVAGTTILSETISLVNLGSTYQETVKITNSGTGTAQKVTLTTVALGAASTPIQSLPSVIGNIAPSGSVTAVFTFPVSAGAPGAAAVAKFAGTYTGGTLTNSVRTTLPQPAQ